MFLQFILLGSYKDHLRVFITSRENSVCFKIAVAVVKNVTKAQCQQYVPLEITRKWFVKDASHKSRDFSVISRQDLT